MPTYRRSRWLSLALTATALVLTAPFAVATGTAHAEAEGTPVPKSVAVPIKGARLALGHVIDHVAARRYTKAAKALLAVQKHLAAAQKAGMRQIGAPPPDPESDESPGPPSVIAVLALDHRIVVRVAGLFDGMTEKVGLGTTLSAAARLRLVMLDKVLSLDPEGAGGDFADGMTDTLPIYSAEVTAVSNMLRTSRLTASSRKALTKNLVRVKEANQKMNAAYGGGE